MSVFENPAIRPDGNSTDGHFLLPSDVIIHENYDREFFFNDIALLYIEDGLKNEKFMKLPDYSINFMNLTGFNATIAGYGKVNDKNDVEDRLKFVQLPIVDGRKCAETYSRNGTTLYDEEIHICLGANEKGSTCG